MIELVNLWVEQVNRKLTLRTLIKNLCFSFQLRIEKRDIILEIDKGMINLEATPRVLPQPKRLEGSEELFLSIILGEKKLREAVKSNEITTTFSFRELLLMETLFYLGKPELLSEFATKTNLY
ncbi:hypothetical protein R4Z10_03830 [Niallia sp. XMNu-256]|uniref:hypothetical protein n=1 Tax=Niallia sp. XMNu-256 TaxID=3082444 RepID=UPI0030D1DE0D